MTEHRFSIAHPPTTPLQVVPQVGINPDVLESSPLLCVGGPCDGQQMRCPEGYALFVIYAVDGPRAVAITEERGLATTSTLGNYAGRYRPVGSSLHWSQP